MAVVSSKPGLVPREAEGGRTAFDCSAPSNFNVCRLRCQTWRISPPRHGDSFSLDLASSSSYRLVLLPTDISVSSTSPILQPPFQSSQQDGCRDVLVNQNLPPAARRMCAISVLGGCDVSTVVILPGGLYGGDLKSTSWGSVGTWNPVAPPLAIREMQRSLRFFHSYGSSYILLASVLTCGKGFEERVRIGELTQTWWAPAEEPFVDGPLAEHLQTLLGEGRGEERQK